MTLVSQNTFATGLLDADAPTPEGLTDATGRHSPRRYAVYRNNVFMSLRDALGEAFPIVKRMIGEANFNNLAAGFLRNAPPHSPLMMFYGAGFADYLIRVPQISHLGYLPDIARLEEALRRAYHAEDAHIADPTELACLDEKSLMATGMTMAPAVTVLRSQWPILSLYNYTLLPDQPEPQPGAQDVLITRPDFDPALHNLPPGGANLIDQLMSGATLSAAMSQAGPDLQLEPVLALFLTSGAVTQFHTNKENDDGPSD